MASQAQYLAEVNPGSHQLYRTAIGFIVVDTLVFGLLMVSMYLHRKRGNYGYIIYLVMLLAYLSVLGNALVGLLLVKIGGVGRHVAFWLATDPKTFTKFLQLQTGIEIIYMASITVPKITILNLYLKIFVDRRARQLTWIMGAILVMFFVAGLILALTLCRPYEYKWNKTINGTCGDIMAGYRWISIPSIITDFFILLIPIPSLWKLRVDTYKKIGVFLTFLAGGLGFITAIVRCLTFYSSNLFADSTYLAGTTMVWTIVESSAYFICACLPRLRPLLQRILEKIGIIAVVVTKTWSSQNETGNSTSIDIFGQDPIDDKTGFVQLNELKLDHEPSNASGRKFEEDSLER